uniref:Potassium channel domain-containing protein n=1 Tax=Percolomonas cosmopolitus TaxID=63605 RepID=A0A7S1PI19_9EUKA|mmetsp:Transcript_5847/g.22176  ORF Transcript_5847/g.22176 Transcript_5847/m.22176 type:complete len:481 (+) Transcript_5847:129-1571(+)
MPATRVGSLETHYTILASLASLGILLMILTNISSFDFVQTGEYFPLEPMQTPWFQNWVFYVYYSLKVANWGNTLLCVALLVWYYIRLTRRECRQWHYSNNIATFIYSGLWKEFLVEFMCLLYTPIFPLPYAWFNGQVFGASANSECPLHPLEPLPSYIYSRLQCYSSVKNYYILAGISDKIGLVMFLRLYMWARVLRDHSAVYKNRAYIIQVFERRKRYLPLIGWRFTLRVAFAKRTFIFLVAMALSCLLFCSFAIWLADRGFNDNLSAIGTSDINLLWFTAVSMMSIGYGDYVPQKYVGKFWAIMSCFLGQLLVSMLTAFMVHVISPSQTFKVTGRYLELDRLQQKRFVEAVRLLQVSWLFKRGKCGFKYMMERKRVAVRRMQQYSKRLFHVQAEVEGTMHDVALKLLEEENTLLEKQVEQLSGQIRALLRLVEPNMTPSQMIWRHMLRNNSSWIGANRKSSLEDDINLGVGMGEESWR